VTDRDNDTSDVDWRAELRARGYRLTPQRELVLEAVDELEHATPEQILGYVRERAPGVNISTIYRTLELLEDLGLVNHTHLDHGAPTYHSTAMPQHVHLKCRNCKRVIEVAPETVEPLVEGLRTEHGFETDVQHLTVFGTCRDCAKTD
jgi:Fur family transcriptional regulator, ferric uptake regulator